MDAVPSMQRELCCFAIKSETEDTSMCDVGESTSTTCTPKDPEESTMAEKLALEFVKNEIMEVNSVLGLPLEEEDDLSDLVQVTLKGKDDLTRREKCCETLTLTGTDVPEIQAQTDHEEGNGSEIGSLPTQWTVTQDRSLSKDCSAGQKHSLDERKSTCVAPVDVDNCVKGAYNHNHADLPRIHAKNQPTDTSEMKFKCATCDKVFESLETLHKHRRSHPGEEQHQCPMCNRCFRRNSDLKQHIRIHTRDSKVPYYCLICYQSFWQIQHLNGHIMTTHRDRTGKPTTVSPVFFFTKDEVILMLRSYQAHGADWNAVMETVQQNSHVLPKQASMFYQVSSMKAIKGRLQKKIRCYMSLRDIKDKEIREIVEDIKRAELEPTGPQLPDCHKTGKAGCSPSGQTAQLPDCHKTGKARCAPSGRTAKLPSPQLHHKQARRMNQHPAEWADPSWPKERTRITMSLRLSTLRGRMRRIQKLGISNKQSWTGNPMRGCGQGCARKSRKRVCKSKEKSMEESAKS